MRTDYQGNIVFDYKVRARKSTEEGKGPFFYIQADRDERGNILFR
ncbi:MAG TPA: hypothetical protein VKY40_03760 [Halanaerobiales bacterium]|nr:hypothetical protein [Halanaerobiales bacterium]